MKLQGSVVRSLRHAKKPRWSQAKLAEEADLSERTVQAAESGTDVTRETVGAIAAALEVDVARIVEPTLDSTFKREAVIEILRTGAYASAPCCAFLAGDLSCLATKRAIVFPIDVRMHVCVHGPAPAGRANVYFPDHRLGAWARDPDVSHNLSKQLRRAFSSVDVRRQFGWCANGIHVSVVSELPCGVAVSEESAVALALATALRQPAHGTGSDEACVAARLLSAFTGVSTTTLLACNEDPASFDDLMLVDYSRDGVTSGEAPSTVRRLPFATGQLSLWWGPRLQASADEHRRFGDRLATLARLPFDYIVDAMTHALVAGEVSGDCERKVGWLMQLHQLALVSGGFVDREAQEVIARVNGLPDVFGAKLAAGRGSGALLVLTKSSMNRGAFAREMTGLGLRRLDLLRTPLYLSATAEEAVG